MFETMRTLINAGCLLLVSFLVLLALPKSKLRDVVMPIAGWGFALLCGIYVASPVDVIPDLIPVVGWVDDVGAIAAGLTSACLALGAGKSSRR